MNPNPVLPPIPGTETVLKRTTSRCPVCRAPVPGEVIRVGGETGRVVLRRRCSRHGEFSAVLASDARFYWLSKGAGEGGDCGCAGGACRASDGASAGSLGRNAAATAAGENACETLSTCVALIEVVDSCNLACPACFAESGVGTGGQVAAPSLAELKRRIDGVVARKGQIEILQLSGGEPTLHPEFFELLAWTMEHPGILYVLLNTNGVRIAREPAFAAELARTIRPGKFQVYLQFDGPEEPGQRELRGADLRAVREQVVRICGDAGIAITLAMTVTRANLGQVWAGVEFGLRFPHVRGITFQPLFRSGRVPAPAPPPGEARGAIGEPNAAEVVVSLLAQSGGRLREADFTPLPCGDPNCAIIGYLLKVGGAVRSVSDFVDFRQVQGFLRDRVRYRLEDLVRCGCESEPLGEMLKRFELDASHTFRLFIKPFMDAWTWDQDRIDRCCTHVIRPDGRLDSFCRYYSGFPDTRVGGVRPGITAPRLAAPEGEARRWTRDGDA